ncbi:FeoA family protein [Streptomyces celluloflavus]|uniref:FeoA family protein n=1 Tax=Streptomyces celluloflavus TaxID=58344 RepID=UPI0036A53A24
MTLRGCGPGTRVRVAEVRVPVADRLRLAELGFVRGAEIRVVGRGTAGGLLVALGDARVALDGATAAGVRVLPPSPTDPATSGPAAGTATPGAPATAQAPTSSATAHAPASSAIAAVPGAAVHA